MDLLIELSLCFLAWLVVIVKTPKVWRDRVWKTDPITLSVWLAMLFFAITVTFLFQSIASIFDAWTLNNLSRLIAYSSVSLTLYFIAVSSLHTYKTPQGIRVFRLLSPLLVVNLLALVVIYFQHIRRISEWRDHHVPQDLAEALFMFCAYSFSFVACLVLIQANVRFLNQERATLMRIRVLTIIMTAGTACLYFAVKIILVGGYFWEPLGANTIVAFSKILLFLSALMWAISFVHNKVYLHLISFLRNVVNYLDLKDMEYLLSRLDRLFQPIALLEEKPSFRMSLRKSEYYLYRATIRILDGKTMLDDVFNRDDGHELTEDWDDEKFMEAEQVHQVLWHVHTSGDFQDIVRSFKIASKQLLRYSHYSIPEAIP